MEGSQVVFKPVDRELNDRAIAGFSEYRKNEEVLRREWPQLLNNHLHQWVAVYNDGKIVVRSSMETIRQAVPEDERDTAVMRYIKQSDNALIL
jgi:hypothetical protein